MISSRPKALVVLLTALVAFGPVSTDLYLASLPDMARVFATDVPTVQLTLSAFLAGFAVAMPVYGPLSDRFGRRPVMLGGIVLYVLASLFCVVAPGIEALIAGRFVQALGACAGPVLGRAVVRDLFERDQAARVLSYMASAMALAPLLAPIAGGWLHASFGWRANFVVLVLFGMALLAASWTILAETNRRPDAHAFELGTMLGNYATLLADRRFAAYAATVALGFGGLFAFISGSSFVLIDANGIEARHFGLSFAVVIAGYVAGGAIAGRFTQSFGFDKMIGLGTLGCAIGGALALASAWTGFGGLSGLLASLSLYFLAAGLTLPNATAGAIAPFPTMAGTASALVGFTQMLAGALAGWLVALLFDGNALPMTATIATLGLASALAFRLLK